MEKIMKRILCLILAATLCIGAALTLGSCGGSDKDIFDLAKELNPTKTVTFVEYKTASGDDLGGEFVLEKDGSDAIFTYLYKKYRTSDELIADNTNERIKEFSGTVYCKDGKYSEDGKTWGSSPVPFELKFDLNKDNLTNVSITDDGKTLSAEIAADKVEAVLGTALSAEGAISLVAVSNGTYLTGITVSCTTSSGAQLVIRTSYSYNELSLVFPEA